MAFVGIYKRRSTLSKILVHIGLPKTGSTTLQEGLFERHSQIRYLGQTNLWESSDAKAVLKSLNTGERHVDLNPVLQSIKEETRAVVISDEALSFGEFMLRAEKWSIESDHIEMAKRIHQMLGDVEIMVVLRRQDAWLESWHKQGLKTGKYIDHDFNNWLTNELSEYERKKLFSLLDYDALVSAYFNQFGKEHVHVFFFEDYRNHFEVLARDIAVSLEVDAIEAEQLLSGYFSNVSGETYHGGPKVLKKLSRTTVGRMVRQCMPWLVKKVQTLMSSEHQYKSLSKETKLVALSDFQDSNKRLMKCLDRLDTHGYY